MTNAERRDAINTFHTLVDFVNTDPSIHGSEGLPDLAALRKFIEGRKITEIAEPNEHELTALRRLRAGLKAVAVAPSEARSELVNALLQSAHVTPQIADHDDLGLHLHYFRRYATLSDHLHADLSMALATLLVSGDGDRLRVCARNGCGRVFYDTTRSRTRIYCSSALCGNRVHAATHRAKNKGAQSSSTGRS
jgi:predicted RNA-binding Zn ribbon-like protein